MVTQPSDRKTRDQASSSLSAPITASGSRLAPTSTFLASQICLWFGLSARKSIRRQRTERDQRVAVPAIYTSVLSIDLFSLCLCARFSLPPFTCQSYHRMTGVTTSLISGWESRRSHDIKIRREWSTVRVFYTALGPDHVLIRGSFLSFPLICACNDCCVVRDESTGRQYILS